MTRKLYRYSDGNTYTDNLTLAQARKFERLQNGGTIVAMDELGKPTQHTPGPWRSFESGSDGARILPDYGDTRERTKYIAIVNGRDTLTDFANARLIAAAPELLDLAQMVAAGNTEFEDLERIARATIAKAVTP